MRIDNSLSFAFCLLLLVSCSSANRSPSDAKSSAGASGQGSELESSAGASGAGGASDVTSAGGHAIGADAGTSNAAGTNAAGTHAAAGANSDGTPSSWTCAPLHYAVGDGCDCGCGAFDPDCGADTSSSACHTSAAEGSCGARSPWPWWAIDAGENARCYAAPSGWTCQPDLYQDGTCDCGCGEIDADCASSDSAECANCDNDGSCSYAESSCWNISSTNNAVCDKYVAGWNCSQDYYADGELCDCGCGVFDPDCASLDPSACNTWNNVGSCAFYAVDPTLLAAGDNSQCVSGLWRCSKQSFGDGKHCDCGCGMPDPDCTSGASSSCDYCDAFGSCANTCSQISPTNNATCR